MTDFFFQMGLSNACFSLALGIVAMVVGARARRPHIAYMLWLLVFVKLVTPPIVKIPIVTIPAQGETAVAVNEHSLPVPALSYSRQLNVEASRWSRLGSAVWTRARIWLPPVWLLGSLVVFALSMVRVCRFGRILAAESEAALQELQTTAAKIARRLGLKTSPKIYTTSARISPMVWWTGGKVRVVIPKALLSQMDAQQWKWILAHELAHVRRRDYLVRWLEWLACTCFWWNPVVWWAQRNLRAAEEICCDELVVSCLNPEPKFYANSLLSAVEFLARPALRPPAMASEINSGGFLERRFKMIVSNKPKRSNTRWLQGIILLCALVVLPVGIASAADYEAVGRRLRAAVAAGELTAEEARAMLETLRRTDGAVKRQGSERARAYLMQVRKELGAAVEAGRISEEDAAKRYQAAEKEIRERMAAGDRYRDIRAEYEGFERRVKAAVREGRMTREEAGEQLAGFKRRMEMAEQTEHAEKRITVEEYKRAEAKMRKMIEDGKAKPEDVERRLIEMRKVMGDQGKRGGERGAGERLAWEGIKKRIEGAVKSGKMTREEADAKYKEIKKQMSQRSEDAVKKAVPKKVDAKKTSTKKISREDLAKAAGEIRKAIAEGKITKEQGRVKLTAMRKMISVKKEDTTGKNMDWEGIKERIESAVKSGKITREQADAKYKAIRERMAGRSKL